MAIKTSKKRSTLKKISRAESASTQLVGCVVTAQLRADEAWNALKWGVDDEGAGARWLSAERDLDAAKDAAMTTKTATKKISRAESARRLAESVQPPVTAERVELARQAMCDCERALHLSRDEYHAQLRAHERLERQLIKARAEFNHAQWLVAQSDTTMLHMENLKNAAGAALDAAVDTYCDVKNMAAK
jgi:hypothetical protein